METTDTVTVYGYADGTAGFTEPCEICGNEVDADDRRTTMSTETPEYCAESVWLDSIAMVCSAQIVDGRCPWHGTEGKRLPVKPTEREDELAARLSEVEAERDAAKEEVERLRADSGICDDCHLNS